MRINLPVLDPAIARAAIDLATATRALRDAPDTPPPNPLEAHREVSTRTAYLELCEAPGGETAVLASREWVRALTLERVLWADRVRAVSAWNERSIEVAKPVAMVASARELSRRAFADANPEAREAWSDALCRGGGKAADAVRLFAERRAEASVLLAGAAQRALDGDGAGDSTAPCDPPEALARTAHALLDRTETLRLPAERWHDALANGLGRNATSGWPARLTARWIAGLFRGTGLLDGLTLRLERLPEPLGATSFARALAVFGGALADADGPASAPFVLTHPPIDLRRERRAALFGGLVTDPLFGMRALGLGKDRARDQAREVARALLVSLRLDAARVLLDGALLAPPRERADRFQELSARALGAPIPAGLGGLLPALSPTDGTRFCGTLLSMLDRKEAIERFDEDWFRSPHFGQALREEDAVLPASTRTTEAMLEAAMSELERAFGALG